MNTILFTGAAAFLLYSLTRRSIAAGTMLFYADRVNSFRFQGLTPVLEFSMRVQNTSNQSFTVNSFAADVYSQNTLIGNASNFIAQTIPANGEMFLRITVRLMPLGIVNDLIQAFQNKNFRFHVNIRGFANVDNLQVPVNLTYNVGI